MEGAMGSMLDLGSSLPDGVGKEKALPDVPKGDAGRPASAQGAIPSKLPPSQAQGHRSRTSLGNFGRLTGGIGNRKTKR